jgi:hypothetical protein
VLHATEVPQQSGQHPVENFLDTESFLCTSAELVQVFSSRDGLKGLTFTPESESDRRHLLELGITADRDRLELLNADSILVKRDQSCNTYFPNAAAAVA